MRVASAWTRTLPTFDPMASTRRLWAGVPLAAVLVGCSGSVAPAPAPGAAIEVPWSWPPVVAATGSDWAPEEVLTLNAALYLVEVSLAPDDPRRSLLRAATFVPSDRMPVDDGPWLEDTEGLFHVPSGNIYLNRRGPADAPALASLLAHELHHMERDRTASVNRMQEVERERIAHAREAEDVGRMLLLLRLQSGNPATLGALELAQAKARGLSAMYSAKFELFRVVQALDKVEGLKQMSELYRLYEECIGLAQAKLSTDHGQEVRLLDALAHATAGTTAQEGLAVAVTRARGAVAACVPFQASVDELRARTGRR